MRRVLWKFAGGTLDLSQRGMIMGVLNVTPDSFSDAGEFFLADAAVKHGGEMARDGADIVDVGGESTRPGANEIDEAEELNRVLPVINGLRAANPVLISIDTSKSAVAAAALDSGAQIVNDVTGGRADGRMMSLVAERGAGFIIMHMQGTPRTMQESPRYDDVVTEVADFFRQQYRVALDSGIDPMAIAFDPGIGFGKTLAHNLALLRNLEALRIDDRPIVVGVSRKSFLAKMIGAEPMADRLAPTIASTALLRERGADILRVHDVKPNAAALRTAEALMGGAR